MRTQRTTIFVTLMLSVTPAIAFSLTSAPSSGMSDDQEIQLQGIVDSAEPLVDAEIAYVVERLLEEDLDLFYTLNESQRRQVSSYIIDNYIYPPDDWGIGFTEENTWNQDRPGVDSLPDCGGYWTPWWEYESIEQRDSRNGLKYEVGPNCYMAAPGDDCGTDHDDFMLSFYFGNHAEGREQLAGMLRWYSTDWWTRVLLDTLSARVYEQNPGGGRDNYDIKICIDDYFESRLETFRLRKY